MTDIDQRQLSATVAAQAQYIAELEARVMIYEDMTQSIKAALSGDTLANTKALLAVKEFDFEGSRSARTQMLQSLKSGSQIQDALSSVLTFAKVFAPIVLA